MFSQLSNGYEELWKAIIRPPRDEYNMSDLGIKKEFQFYNIKGPNEFKIQGVKVKRTDFTLPNQRGLKLECSFFEPTVKPCEQLPCLVYLHANSSSRLESLPCVPLLLPQMITLFSFDFAGCGRSEGEFISLGWYERDDVATVVDWLRTSGKVSTIGLWGRSMGAVTGLMHADRDPSIAGLVLDSPFSNLRTLAEELAKNHSKVPSIVLSGAIAMIRKTILTKAKFDIDMLNPLENHVKKAFIPAFFVTGKQDSLISPDHTKRLYTAYAGDKNMVLVDGDHNTQRPQFLLDSIAIFLYQTLQVKELVPQYNVILNYIHYIEKGQQQQQQNQQQDDNYFPQNQHQFMMYQGENMGVLDEEEMIRKAIEESLKISESKVEQKPKNELKQPSKDLMEFDDF